MAPASNEEQFKFLISCIRYSNNGKVDFGEVARECSIVTKGAAAKRYERMMKAHGIHQSATTVRDTPIPSRRQESKPCTTKKRKLDQFSNINNSAGDDDEGFGAVKAEAAGPVIKDEPTTIEEDSEPVHNLVYSNDDNSVPMPSDDNTLFDNFLRSGAFEQTEANAHISYEDGIIRPGYSGANDTSGNGSGEAIHESILIAD